MNLGILINRRWWKITLLVVVAVAVMIRLGFWQLDRLEQRKEFNTRVETQLTQPRIELDPENLDEDLFEMEYRDAVVIGEFDHQNQVVLRNQDWQGRLGVHLLTPFLINGSDMALLVDRGWVPYEDFTAGNLAQYDEPGQVEVNGTIRRSQIKPRIGGQPDAIPGPGEPPLKAWNWINVNAISGQMPYELLQVYLHASPKFTDDQMPYREELDLELTEGSHFGYAVQWFIFASILAIGYPIYVRREEERAASSTKKEAPYVQKKAPVSPNNEPKGYEIA